MQNGSNNFFVRLLLTALAVLVTAYLLPGVEVSNFFWALLVAGVLALFNVTIKRMKDYVKRNLLAIQMCYFVWKKNLSHVPFRCHIRMYTIVNVLFAIILQRRLANEIA